MQSMTSCQQGILALVTPLYLNISLSESLHLCTNHNYTEEMSESHPLARKKQFLSMTMLNFGQFHIYPESLNPWVERGKNAVNNANHNYKSFLV